MAELVLLSIIQGVTEFLPISSSAHLILVSEYFNFNNSNLTLDISLHLGSLLAIIFYFRKEFNKFIEDKNLLKKIIVTSIPVVFFGFVLIKLNLIDNLRSFKIIGWCTIIFGIILYLSDLKKNSRTIKKNFSFKKVVIIGFFQTLSLLPGVSRSGIVITTSRLLCFRRVESAKIAFLTSIPILVIASAYNFYKIILQKNLEISSINISGIIFSFIFSYLTIKFFINFLKNYSLTLFVIYRIILGIFILLYVYI